MVRSIGQELPRELPHADRHSRDQRPCASDIVPGGVFPDYALPDHTGTLRTLSELQGATR